MAALKCMLKMQCSVWQTPHLVSNVTYTLFYCGIIIVRLSCSLVHFCKLCLPHFAELYIKYQLAMTVSTQSLLLCQLWNANTVIIAC